MTQSTSKTASEPDIRALPPTVVTDVPTQSRGLQAAVLGLIVQLLCTVGISVAYGFGAYLSALFYLSVIGTAVWITIALTYAFRRQAAVENVEVEEALRRGQTEQSIFVDMADARPAARRVRRVYNYLIPTVTGISGGALVTVASINLARAVQATGTVGPTSIPPAGVAAILAALAFVGFIAGRYAIGLGRIPAHKLLRAGGVFLVGTCALLFLAAIAYGILHFGATPEQKVTLPVRILIYLLPTVGIIIGVEFLLNLLLDLYRPRRRGEEPRASFESRLFGLFGAPGGFVASLNEAINYQFGFEITQSWFWRLIAKNFVWLLLFGTAALLLMSSVYIVEPQQQAIVTFAGRITHDKPIGPGLGFKWPWPLGTVETYDVRRIRTMTLGGTQTVTINAQLEQNSRQVQRTPLLFDNRSTDTDQLMLLSANRRAVTTTAADQAPAVALAGAEVHINYRISDLRQYVETNPPATSEDGDVQDPLFRDIADQVTNEELMRVTVDHLLGPGREAVAGRIKNEIARQIKAAGLGLEVTYVGIAGVHPAQQVADAFLQKNITDARAAAEIERARADAIQFFSEVAGSQEQAEQIIASIEKLQQLQHAGDEKAIATQRAAVEDLIENADGVAAQLLVGATSERFTKELNERSRVAEFQGQLTAYRAAPDYVRTTMWLDKLAETLPNARQFLSTVDGAETEAVIDYSSLGSGGINIDTGG